MNYSCQQRASAIALPQAQHRATIACTQTVSRHSMEDKEMDSHKLHISGASFRHTPPFNDLKSFDNDFELPQDFIDKWILPFYLNIGRSDKEWIYQLTSVKNEISADVIEKNLGDRNWRSRQTGAFFSAITSQTRYIDIIGTR